MREFLKGLELDKETIDSIMAEHGKLVTGLREKAVDLEGQLKTANEGLMAETARTKELEGWKSQKEQEDAASTSAIEQVNKEKTALERTNAALLKGVPADKVDAYVRLTEGYINEATPFDEALGKALEAFPISPATPPSIPGAGGNPPLTPPPLDFGKMTSEERIDLREKDPTLYATLRNKYLGG